jgi:hypothetical protein
MEQQRINTTDLDEFLRQAKPARRSPCADYVAEIDYLLAHGAAQAKVIEWLAMPPRNVRVTPPDLSRWLARRRVRREKLASKGKDKAGQAGKQAEGAAAHLDPRAPAASGSQAKPDGALTNQVTGEAVRAPWKRAESTSSLDEVVAAAQQAAARRTGVGRMRTKKSDDKT